MLKKEYTPPPAIKVGGVEFKIVLKKMSDFGDFDVDKKLIRIRQGLSPTAMFDTLMHEVAHAALAISGLSNILDDENLEEAIVRIADYILFPTYQREYENYREKYKKEA